MDEHRVTTRLTAALLVAAIAGSATLPGALAASELTVDPTPSGPNEADSTHALTMTIESGDAVAGAAFEDVLVDYSPAQPTADVSNVGTADVERVGIDRGDDAVGTRVDVTVDEIGSVSATKDGEAVRLDIGGNYDLRAGDEVVVVLQNVQNPQNAGTSTVELTVNTQGGATSATGSVTYEQHDASVSFRDQTSDGDAVVIETVDLSEGGFVAVQDVSGANPDAVRGVSTYLSPGPHSTVTVDLDTPLSSDADLVAQVYTDSDGDHSFDFVASGGERDGPYRNADDNLVGTDSASVALADGTTTPTPTPTPTPSPTPTVTPTPTPSDAPTATSTPSDAPTATSTPSDAPTDTPSASPTATGTPSITETPQSGGATETPGGSGPGFGVVIGVVALLAAGLLARH